LALPLAKTGVVAFVDLETYEIRRREVSAPPTRVRLTPDGRAALVVSDRSKQAWVIQ